ncbi:Tautomerase/MIF superfamily [Lactarius deliciosus]|nr:Tautomerase/MIF superfamily [Lactarius deliciosus]
MPTLMRFCSSPTLRSLFLICPKFVAPILPVNSTYHTSQLGADLLNKPEKYISITYRYNEFLTFGGTFDPAFQLTVISLDNITPESTETYSNALFTFLKDTLGVPGDRGYILFNDPGRANIG